MFDSIHAPTPAPPKEERGKLPPFTQVYPRGWDTINEILTHSAAAAKVYTFIAKHCDHLNALVCPIEVMVDELGMSEKTIRRATKWLHDEKHLTIIKVGTANAYVLDHRDIWKNYENYKDYCSFGAQTLVSKKANRALKTRLTMMMEGQTDLFVDPETGEIR